jgi:hypothetical protein
MAKKPSAASGPPPNAFLGQAAPPTDDQLTAAVGRSRDVWDRLLAALAKDCNLVTQEWHCYSPKTGWSLRLKVKDRNILYLSPCHGSFQMAVILGDKSIAAARKKKLPAPVMKPVREGKKYPEGTVVRIAAVRVKNIPAIVQLAGLKRAH